MKKILIILALPLLFVCTKIDATTYYFSISDGDDSRSASQAQDSNTPWKTIDKLNSIFSSLQPGDVILFKSGDVFYGRITVNNSGSSGSPISFGSYGSGAQPIISGFTTVTAWTSVGRNLWMSSSAISGLASLNMVAVNGSFTPIGKWPNNGYNSITSSSGGTSLTSILLGSAKWNGATVVIRKQHWILDKSIINSQSGATLGFSSPSNYTSQKGWGFLIQNAQAACDKQGEWWYDASSKKLGIYSSGTPAGVQASTVDNLLSIGSSSNISFKNISFQGSNSATVSISSGSNIDFENCSFLFQGTNGFTVQQAANHITLNNCTANYTNNDFIDAGGSSYWTLTNNLVRNTAQTPGMGSSGDGSYIALYNIGPNSLIQYNKIVKTGYNGIDFRGSSITVSNNLVDTFCNVKDDGAGLYTFTGSSAATYSERTVSNNIVLNGGGAGTGTNTANSDAYGIYMDDNTSNVTISGNTVANCGSAGIFLHGNHDLIVTDNTVYNNALTGGYGQIFIMEASSYQPTRNITLTGNKFVSKAATQVVAYYQTDQNDLSQLGTFKNNYYCRPINETSTLSLVKSSGNSTTTLAGWQSGYDQDAGSGKSPKTITTVNELRFEYNASPSDKTVNLGATYMDVTGTKYAGSITLAPYGSAVLIYVSGTVVNKPPVANAGNSQIIMPPVDTAALNGSASTDPDGTIASYQWKKISGPASATIDSPTIAITHVSALTPGNYQFELTVTDNQGAAAKDTVTMNVNTSTVNKLPVANAGPDITVQIPTFKQTTPMVVGIKGSATDSDGTIKSYQWRKIDGPECTIQNPDLPQASIGNLVKGIYDFELSATDNQNATARDTVQVSVLFIYPDTSTSTNTGAKKKIVDGNQGIAESGYFKVFPNPIADNFTLALNNNFTGKMNIKIVSAAGVTVRSFESNKDQPTSQLNLNIKELAAGVYYVHVQIGEWSDVKKILKL